MKSSSSSLFISYLFVDILFLLLDLEIIFSITAEFWGFTNLLALKLLIGEAINSFLSFYNET